MGMYDSIMMDIKCPFCNKESRMEVQTKELECDLMVFNVGDDVSHFAYTSLEYLDCITDCNSEECMEHEAINVGYKSGFGRMFELDVMLDNGVITGEYSITKLL